MPIANRNGYRPEKKVKDKKPKRQVFDESDLLAGSSPKPKKKAMTNEIKEVPSKMEIDAEKIQMEAEEEESTEAEEETTGLDVTGGERTEDESMYEGGPEDSFMTTGAASDMSEVEEEGSSMLQDPDQILKFSINKDMALLGLPAQSEIFFKGCLQIRLIKGCISVQGYTLCPAESFTSIYSPRGHSLLSITTSAGESTLSSSYMSDVSDEKVMECEVVFEAKRLNEDWIDFLKKSLKKSEQLKLFGRDTSLTQPEDRLVELEKCLDITLFKPDTMSVKLWSQGKDWNVALTSMNLLRRSGEQPRLLAAGGKGVGKSSFTRWITNRLLEEGEVIFLDLDPGQKEFGLPGYLTLAVIDAPLLGPNFCQPEPRLTRSVYFGDINVSNNPGRYIRSVRRLLKMLKELDTKAPLVINTMGWCQGLGLLLNTDIIRLCKPTTLVQILSRFSRKNYPQQLTSEYINKSNSWSRISDHLTFNHLEFSAVPERRCAKDMRSNDSWGIPQPLVLRDIQTLSWFGKRGGVRDLPVFSIHFSQVCLNVAHEKVPPRGLLAALLLQPVDLCAVDPDTVRRSTQSDNYSILTTSPLAESLGVGIIRGVDSEERLIFVATQLSEDTLQKVNCLVGGHLSLPSGLLAKQKTPSPYLAPDTPCNPLDQPWQRLHKHGQFA